MMRSTLFHRLEIGFLGQRVNTATRLVSFKERSMLARQEGLGAELASTLEDEFSEVLKEWNIDEEG